MIEHQFFKILEDCKLGKAGEILKIYSDSAEMEDAIALYDDNMIVLVKDPAIKNKDVNKSVKKSSISIQGKVLMLLQLKQRREATELLVEEVKQQYTFYATKNDEASIMYAVQDGRADPNGECIIKEIIRGILGQLYTATLSNEIIEKIRADSFIEEDKLWTKKNPDEELVINGVLNKLTKQLRPVTREDVFMAPMPVIYDPQAKCPNFEKFLSEIVSPQEQINLIEMMAWSMQDHYNIQKWAVLTGSGANGKTTFCHAWRMLIGESNTISISPIKLEKDTFSACMLRKARLNLCSDDGKQTIDNTGKLKSLTGGEDVVTADRKFQTAVSFVNRCKIVVSYNELPEISDKTHGLWRRIFVIRFDKRFLYPSEQTGAEDELKADPLLKDKITTPEELSGILNRVLDAYTVIEKRGDFSPNNNQNSIQEWWRKRADNLAAFIEKHCTVDYSVEVAKIDFRTAYIQYCAANKLVARSDKEVKERLATMGVVDDRSVIDGHQVRVWVGIRLNPIGQVTLP